MTMHSWWTPDQKVIVSILYSLAIITGTFRSCYRLYISRFWWEDIWAMVALLLDILCLVVVWISRLSGVMEAIVLTSGLWAARMSMIATIIRITKHCVQIRRPAYATAVAFGIMWVATLVQKLYICVTRICLMDEGVATSQLVTDVISDTLLMALPLYFLRGVRLEHSRRVLLVSSFASSICITIISITHSVFLYLPYMGTSWILAHVKTALALIICNLLVIVTFVYRFCRRSDLDVDGDPTKSGDAQFTSVISGKWSQAEDGVLRPKSPGSSGRQSPSVPNVSTP